MTANFPTPLNDPSASSGVSIFDINSPETARKFLYGFLPVLGVLLVGQGTLSDVEATQWIGLALAVLSPAVAAIKTRNGFRTWVYPVIAGAGAIVVGYGIVDGETWALWFTLVPAVLGNVAAGNTHDAPAATATEPPLAA
ncbi:holin [Gordonia phage Skog]|uniref:Holin n=1 Tax=Gordonia phage Skog TaxID=2704033 RepID=A0A6G6XJB3_9CAUD|nr:holin [Gordonia phage Skog]QIG58157.1 holin [Gordonia phage Skog]